MKKASEINKKEKEMNKPVTVRADVAVAHNYSSQALNSTELAREKLRQLLAKVRICLPSHSNNFTTAGRDVFV